MALASLSTVRFFVFVAISPVAVSCGTASLDVGNAAGAAGHGESGSEAGSGGDHAANGSSGSSAGSSDPAAGNAGNPTPPSGEAGSAGAAGNAIGGERGGSAGRASDGGDGDAVHEDSGSGGSAATGGSGGAPGNEGSPTGPNPDSATRMKCSGTNPIACHFGGAPGNYEVTVVLGGASAGNTVVQAETNRVMLAATPTNAGQTARFAFGVNVRQPEGQPIQNVSPGTPGLDVYFAGTMGAMPQLASIGYAPATSPLMVYVAGDSTVCDQPGTGYGGWGQMLPQYFQLPVVVANYADSGESSGSFLASTNLFGAIASRLKPNDWVLIQFGHNDKTTSASAFHDNMTKLVLGVKAKGAFPVLVTPVARAQFSGQTVSPQHINGAGANLPQIIKQVAMEQNTPVLDLLARTITWLNELGPKGWQAYHANGTDVTHTNQAGAAVEAGFLRDLLKQSTLTALSAHLR